MNFAFWKNSLKQAIERGLNNGDLRGELKELDGYSLSSIKDGEAVYWGLQQLNDSKGDAPAEQAYQLANLFTKIKSSESPATEVLRVKGVPELIRLYDLLRKENREKDQSNILYVLKILALYGTTDGVLKIIEAAQEPFAPENYMWHVILGVFEHGHPQNSILYSSLADPLPVGFIAVALLDAANKCLLAGEEITHPFDQREGIQRLRTWVISRTEDHYSYARSACAALPFLKHETRDDLLSLAEAHPDPTVQVESAWAEAKIGSHSGLQRLAAQCLDLRCSVIAKQYLQELDRIDIIPPEANRPDFAALSEFNQWLAHPSELGCYPDALEIVDNRELLWPPDRLPKPYWLIKYTRKDKTGLEEDDEECGMVGGVTFCFFSYKLSQRPPEDAYAVHCYWEMTHGDLIEELDVSEESNEYDSLLVQWKGEPLTETRILKVADLSPKLGLTERIMALASARLADEHGWVVLDAQHTTWYPKADFPENSSDDLILKIHVGRRLLGFMEQPDRRKYLRPAAAQRSAKHFIIAYEKLLADAAQTEGKAREDALDIGWSPIGKHLEAYAAALCETGGASSIRSVIELLEPTSEHCAGYGTLGRVSHACGQYDLAENFLLKCKGACANWERGKEMSLLAELWLKDGKIIDAKQLLVDCLLRVLLESKTATGTDRQLFENWFQTHRMTYLRIFEPTATDELEKAGVPSSTLG